MADEGNNTATEPGTDTSAATPSSPASVLEGVKKEVEKPATSGGKVTAAVDMLFKIILLGSIGYIGYMVYEQDKAVNVLFEQQNEFFGQQNNNNARIIAQQAAVEELQQQLQVAVVRARQDAAELVAAQAIEIERLANELVSTRLRINSSSIGASQEFLIAEAASVLRLARQHLVVARDMRTAEALYVATDDVLNRIDDPAIYAVREMLAGELASIRAVTKVDISSMYLELGTVADQVSALRVTNDLDTQIAAGERVSLAADATQEKTGWLSRFFNRLRNTFSNYFVVRRRDVAIQPLMTPGQEAALMQSIRLQIEQGRTALLQGEQEIYSTSLGEARDKIASYLAGPGNTRANILAALDGLRARRIVTEVPPLNRALPALEQILSVQESAGIQ
jgi:uroporphyrin-3 C-methyltransferase